MAEQGYESSGSGSGRTSGGEGNDPLVNNVLASESMLIRHHRVILKVGMVGDGQIGKTSLMVKYVEGSFEFVTLFPMARRRLKLTHTQ
jgi:GTP-binding protein of the ras superfamily involved in termination of M-phase